MKLPETQLQEVLYLLITNKSITRLEATRYGILNLPARIYDLRKLNVDIIIKNNICKNKFGRTVNYATYILVNLQESLTIYKKMLDN